MVHGMSLSEVKDIPQASSLAATRLSLGFLLEKKTNPPQNKPKRDITFTPKRHALHHKTLQSCFLQKYFPLLCSQNSCHFKMLFDFMKYY